MCDTWLKVQNFFRFFHKKSKSQGGTQTQNPFRLLLWVFLVDARNVQEYFLRGGPKEDGGNEKARAKNVAPKRCSTSVVVESPGRQKLETAEILEIPVMEDNLATIARRFLKHQK